MTVRVDVGYDVTATVSGRTGVARYARELVAAAAQHDVSAHLLAVGRGPFEPPVGTRRIAVPLRFVQSASRVLGVPRAEWLLPGIELVHSLDLHPLPTGLPTVVTVHDLAALERPDLHSPRQVSQQQRQLRSLASASAVCAVSEATRAALCRHGLAPD